MTPSMRGLVAAAVLAATGPAGAQEAALDDGYWVIVASYPEAHVGDPRYVDPIRDKAVACGLDLFGDYSAKFEGFAAGYIVTVLYDAYPDRGSAELALGDAKRCFPDAYLKKGRYAGE